MSTGHAAALTFFLMILLALGTAGNTACFIVFSQRSMLQIPAYFGLRLISVCDTVLLWLLGVRVIVEIAYDFDLFGAAASPPWLQAIATFTRWTAAQFSYWLLVVIAFGNCLATCCCPERRHRVTCCNQPMAWVWAMLVALPCVCAGLIVSWSGSNDVQNNGSVLPMTSLPASSTGVAKNLLGLAVPVSCVANIVVGLLILFLAIQAVCYNRTTPHPATAATTYSHPQQRYITLQSTLALRRWNTGYDEVMRGTNVNVALIIILTACVYVDSVCCVSIYYRPVVGRDGLQSAVTVALHGIKFIVYVITLPEFRRRLAAMSWPCKRPRGDTATASSVQPIRWISVA